MLKIIGITIVTMFLCSALSFSQSMTIHSKNAVKSYTMAEIDSITFELGEEIELSNFRIYENETTGWTGTNYLEFHTCDEFLSIMNGGAEEYCRVGLERGFFQTMQTKDSVKTFQLLLLVSELQSNASTAYNQKVNKYQSTKEAAGSHSATTAFLVPDDYGYTLYANSASYFIYLSVDNYGTNKSQAKNDALSLFNVLLQKIESSR